MKNFFKLMILPFCLLAVACSSDDEGYNADTAITPYNPMSENYKTVKGIKMSVTDSKGEHTWSYKFNYDAQRRIKSIDGEISTYQLRNNTRWYKLNIKSIGRRDNRQTYAMCTIGICAHLVLNHMHFPVLCFAETKNL
ncbi:MAG: hypothetical protein IIV57_04005, partial [Bacteroidaceae bacterium]|nr:hypothetical protein [Bacteroidaceae bacterium]